MLNHFGENVAEAELCFDAKFPSWGFPSMLSLSELLEKDDGFIEDGEVMIFAELDVFESVGTFDGSEESEDTSEHLSKIRQNDGAESIDLPKKTLPVKESNVVNVTKQVRNITNFV